MTPREFGVVAWLDLTQRVAKKGGGMIGPECLGPLRSEGCTMRVHEGVGSLC